MPLTSEQQLIADSAADLLGRQADSAAVRAAIAQGGFDPALWQQVAGLGWCGVHLPERCGGLGLGLVELCVLAEALGRHLAPVPWFETAVLAGQALAASSGAMGATGATGGSSRVTAWLQSLAEGRCRATLSLGDDGPCWTGRHAALRATATPAGWQLDGLTAPLPGAAVADLWLMTASTAQGEALLLGVPRGAAGASVQPVANHDLTRPLAQLKLVWALGGKAPVQAQIKEITAAAG